MARSRVASHEGSQPDEKKQVRRGNSIAGPLFLALVASAWLIHAQPGAALDRLRSPILGNCVACYG